LNSRPFFQGKKVGNNAARFLVKTIPVQNQIEGTSFYLGFIFTTLKFVYFIIEHFDF